MGNIHLSLKMVDKLNRLGKVNINSLGKANINRTGEANINRIGEANVRSVLPPEVLELILKLLAPCDLRSAVLVCQLWREVGEAPGLWTWLLPTATRERLASTVEVLASRRMREVRELRVEHCHRQCQQIVNAINSHSKLCQVTFNNCNLRSVQAKALAVALTALDKFDIQNSVLDRKQLLVLFTQISDNTTLRSICIFKTDLSSIKPGLLARALRNLMNVKLSDTRLTREQVEAVFTTVGQQDTQMISLEIESNESVSLVGVSLLATTVQQLQVVNLNGIQVTSQQAKAICHAICAGSRLRVFTCQSLHLEASGLLSRAANKLEVLHTELFRGQTEAVLALSLVRKQLRQLSVEIIQGFVNEQLIEKAKQNIECHSTWCNDSDQPTG